MEQKCVLEKQIFQNALLLSNIALDEMSFRIMKTLNYTAVTSEYPEYPKIIHLIKSIPVDCQIRQIIKCHNELPVIHRKHSYFLAPKSRILIKTGTQRNCNELFAIMFKIHDSWFRSTPILIETISSPNIQYTYIFQMEVRKPSIPRHKRNLLNR